MCAIATLWGAAVEGLFVEQLLGFERRERRTARLPGGAVDGGLRSTLPAGEGKRRSGRGCADRLGLDRSHLVGHLDVLERREPVRRDEGLELVRHLQAVAHRSQEESLGVLSASERRTLVELMRRVVQADDAAQVKASS